MNKLYFSQVVVANRNSHRCGTRQNLIVSSPDKDKARQMVELWKDRYDEITSFAELENAIDTDESAAGTTYIKFLD